MRPIALLALAACALALLPGGARAEDQQFTAFLKGAFIPDGAGITKVRARGGWGGGGGAGGGAAGPHPAPPGRWRAGGRGGGAAGHHRARTCRWLAAGTPPSPPRPPCACPRPAGPRQVLCHRHRHQQVQQRLQGAPPPRARAHAWRMPRRQAPAGAAPPSPPTHPSHPPITQVPDGVYSFDIALDLGTATPVSLEFRYVVDSATIVTVGTITTDFSDEEPFGCERAGVWGGGGGGALGVSHRLLRRGALRL